MPLIDIIAIIISISAAAVTIIAFFASLKFYKDGIELQNTSTRILTQIEERTGSIQLQMHSVFDKTLDAALSNRQELAPNISEIHTELENIMDRVKHLQTSGEQEREVVLRAIQEDLGLVSSKVEKAQQVAEEFDRYVEEEQVLMTLVGGLWKDREMIAKNLKLPSEVIDEILDRLFKKGLIGIRDTDKGLLFRHRYVGEYLTKEEAYIARGATPKR